MQAPRAPSALALLGAALQDTRGSKGAAEDILQCCPPPQLTSPESVSRCEETSAGQVSVQKFTIGHLEVGSGSLNGVLIPLVTGVKRHTVLLYRRV